MRMMVLPLRVSDARKGRINRGIKVALPPPIIVILLAMLLSPF